MVKEHLCRSSSEFRFWIQRRLLISSGTSGDSVSYLLVARFHFSKPSILALLVSADILIYSVAYVYFTLGSFRASKSIHSQLLESIFGTTFRFVSFQIRFYAYPWLFRWLDVTPMSRIIARCTGDMDSVDDSLSEGFWDLMGEFRCRLEVLVLMEFLLDTTLGLLTRFLAVILFTPLFFAPGLLIGIIGAWCGKIYMVRYGHTQ